MIVRACRRAQLLNSGIAAWQRVAHVAMMMDGGGGLLLLLLLLTNQSIDQLTTLCSLLLHEFKLLRELNKQ